MLEARYARLRHERGCVEHAAIEGERSRLRRVSTTVASNFSKLMRDASHNRAELFLEHDAIVGKAQSVLLPKQAKQEAPIILANA